MPTTKLRTYLLTNLCTIHDVTVNSLYYFEYVFDRINIYDIEDQYLPD